MTSGERRKRDAGIKESFGSRHGDASLEDQILDISGEPACRRHVIKFNLRLGVLLIAIDDRDDEIRYETKEEEDSCTKQQGSHG